MLNFLKTSWYLTVSRSRGAEFSVRLAQIGREIGLSDVGPTICPVTFYGVCGIDRPGNWFTAVRLQHIDDDYCRLATVIVLPAS